MQRSFPDHCTCHNRGSSLKLLITVTLQLSTELKLLFCLPKWRTLPPLDVTLSFTLFWHQQDTLDFLTGEKVTNKYPDGYFCIDDKLAYPFLGRCYEVMLKSKFQYFCFFFCVSYVCKIQNSGVELRVWSYFAVIIFIVFSLVLVL